MLAQLQFVVFLVLRYLVTGHGLAATLSVAVKTLVLYAIMITGFIWEEEPFGWMKTYGLLGKLLHRGRERVYWVSRLTATAYNITRLKGLMA